MTLHDRLRAMVETVPVGGSVILPRDWLVEQLAAENGAQGSREGDDLARVRPGTPPPARTDHLLTAKEAARVLHVTPRWLYRHAGQLPFTRRLGPKTVRFDAEGLAKWEART